MEHEKEQQTKWSGKARAKLTRARAEQVWPLLEDFCNLHKWHQNLDTCKYVEGIVGQPGCVRYCANTPTPNNPSWVKERLVAINPIQRTLSYEILDNNIGFGEYMGTMSVVSESDHDGCTIEWSFVSDPVQGLTQEGLLSFIESTVQAMAKRMEEALCQS